MYLCIHMIDYHSVQYSTVQYNSTIIYSIVHYGVLDSCTTINYVWNHVVYCVFVLYVPVCTVQICMYVCMYVCHVLYCMMYCTVIQYFVDNRILYTVLC